MVFSSPVFLFFFLPIALLFTYLFRGRKAQNFVLLIASLVFYAWGEKELVLLMLFSIALNYVAGLLIDHYTSSVSKKIVLGIGVTANLSLLLFYKYANFICDNINEITALAGFEAINISPVHLPIGISFFTFQSLSFLIDVYRKVSTSQKNPINLALYISLFPQLIAGPIVRYHDVAQQLLERETSTAHFFEGVKRFVMGLGKKVLVANPLGLCADTIFSVPADELNLSISWLGIVAYSLQIYFDFSGYSDMAIGLGKMFGFDFLENFNYPYISKSIKEFWRRWHISLSNWFRDYLYIPLGGNRLGTSRMYVNLLLVFFLTGLWHGAAWNFILWGLFHGFFLVIERVGFDKILNKVWKPIQHLYMLLVVIVGWVLFRAESLSYGISFIKSMFVPDQISSDSQFITKYMNDELPYIFALGLLFSTPIFNYVVDQLSKIGVRNNSVQPLLVNYFLRSGSLVFYAAIMLLSAMSLAGNIYNPFIYFRF